MLYWPSLFMIHQGCLVWVFMTHEFSYASHTWILLIECVLLSVAAAHRPEILQIWTRGRMYVGPACIYVALSIVITYIFLSQYKRTIPLLVDSLDPFFGFYWFASVNCMMPAGLFCAWSLLASEVMCVSWLLRCWVLMAIVLWCLQTFTNDEGRGAVPCQWFEQASTDLHTPSHDNCSFSNWLDRSLCKI